LAPASPALVRRLTIVGGKGGVGKTTAACALAVDVAGDSRRVLLVSTDPAPSIADALDTPVADSETAVAGAPGLVARQMDAAAAFERMRTRYRERVDALFDAFVAAGVDAAYDRAILRDLLALAPPGVDEVYALASLGETLAEARFDVVVVDPAPTGHLLRLLEMPALALDWAHRLMRLMLKYREVGGLGEAAEDLLGFARRTRALAALLADAASAGLLAVALDEPLVRAETERLVAAVRARGVDVLGVLWNRAAARPSPLSATPAVPQFVAAAVDPPPRGVAALRRWRADWRTLAAGHD
jgi:arsenite-transporting ATPase